MPGIARQIKRLLRVDARRGAGSVGYSALVAEYESTVTQFLTIKVYCTNIGDAGVPDVPHPSEDLDGAIEAAGSRLAYNFKSKKGPKEKPTQSILVNNKSRVLARFRMTPLGLERVEIGTEYADYPSKLGA